MMVVALTGGIGCGKSTVSHHLESLGVPVIDADTLAHRLVEPGSPALSEIQAAFGNHIVNAEGTLDRMALRRIIFENPKERNQLEKILHPRIREAMKAWIASQASPYIVLVIPLLFETGQTDLADRVLVIDCDESQQIKRVLDRDGHNTAEIQQILDSQVDRKTRLNNADDIIENDESLERLIEATEQMHQYYLKLGRSSIAE